MWSFIGWAFRLRAAGGALTSASLVGWRWYRRTVPDGPRPDEIPERLGDHLRHWVGEWPPHGRGITVIASPKRESAGWDGRVHDLIGVVSPFGGVLSVPVAALDAVAALVGGNDLAADLAVLHAALDPLSEAMGRPGAIEQDIYRWSTAPIPGADVGEWVSTSDPRLPDWLRPFNGDILVAWDDTGAYGAGVGRKQHDAFGHELSVGTEPALRGRGLGRHLVAAVARRVLDDGAIPTYAHVPANHASAKVAIAAGFPDLGWTMLSFASSS